MKEIEEEAREYAKKKYGLEDSWEMNIQESACMDGYMAGAKAYEIKWHDLRKNPDEVPKNKNECVLAVYDFGYWNTTKVQNTKIMTVEDFKFYTVIAWCELPIF